MSFSAGQGNRVNGYKLGTRTHGFVVTMDPSKEIIHLSLQPVHFIKQWS